MIKKTVILTFVLIAGVIANMSMGFAHEETAGSAPLSWGNKEPHGIILPGWQQSENDAIFIRKAEKRGHFKNDWLDYRLTFSFGHYRDPRYMGFHHLRTLNECWLQPKQGFAPHHHQNEEIISYVLEGALEHQDSAGHVSVIHAGEIQHTTAGPGIVHSEYNHSRTEVVHFLQIIVVPEQENIQPDYEWEAFPRQGAVDKFRLIVSRDGREGSIRIHQNIALYETFLGAGKEITDTLPPGRYGWLQVARGVVMLNGELLKAGDGAAVQSGKRLRITAREDCNLLLFDLA